MSQNSFTCANCALFNPGGQPYQCAGPICKCENPRRQTLSASQFQQQMQNQMGYSQSLYQNPSGVPSYIIRMEQKLDEILKLLRNNK